MLLHKYRRLLKLKGWVLVEQMLQGHTRWFFWVRVPRKCQIEKKITRVTAAVLVITRAAMFSIHVTCPLLSKCTSKNWVTVINPWIDSSIHECSQRVRVKQLPDTLKSVKTAHTDMTDEVTCTQIRRDVNTKHINMTAGNDNVYIYWARNDILHNSTPTNTATVTWYCTTNH